MTLAIDILADGFVFTEGPRWHDGRLWCSDIHAHRVVAVSPDGQVETMAEVVEDDPSGLGWLPDGRLLVVSMERQWLLRQEPDGTMVCHADLSSEARGDLNDMIVAADGTAYVGDMGGRVHRGGGFGPGQTFQVRPDGTFEVAAQDLMTPNGHILTEDETTLIVAESGGSRLTAFDRAPNGSVSNRRLFAQLAPSDPAISSAPPDGVCLDAEGAVWVADPAGRRVLRVREGGAVTDVVDFAPELPVACVLGGEDRRSLYVCVAPTWRRDELVGTRDGRIAAIGVTVPGAGKP
jgi:sugar lactone lactonase YvrE